MNKIFFIAVGLMLLTACSQEEVFTYGQEKESIQFFGNTVDLGKSFNFFTTDKEKDSLFVTFSLMGQPSTEDRKFYITVESDELNAAGVSLVKLENPYTFKANKIKQQIGIEIAKPAVMGSDFNVYIVINSSNEGSDFEQGVIEQQKFMLVVQNKIGKPAAWDQMPIYGSYSDAKYEFMIEICGNVNFFDYATCWGYWDTLIAALMEYNETHDPDKPFDFFS